ncbi:MAG: carboxypeptidase-like regulatory domain-containing protein [Bacteroidales bacterium]|nr:carboxypeptidase-like regulatory domain-containing protein [Bacteroidales bacterium]
MFVSNNSKEVFNGVVVDAQTNEPMAYVYIYLPDYGDGTITDLKGGFTLTIKNFLPSKNKVIASYVGYKSEIIFLSKNTKNILIKMDPAVQVLQEVVVRKQKYQNRNNPAVDLIEKSNCQ